MTCLLRQHHVGTNQLMKFHITIITRKEIEEFGYSTLEELIEKYSVFTPLNHRSETDLSIGVRGFCGTFNRNVMIQVNGVSMFNERQNYFPLNKINIAIESIEKVEFIRGPTSYIWCWSIFWCTKYNY